MKLSLTVAACLLISGAAFAQATTPAKTSGQTKIRRTAIGGTIKDARRNPVPKVQAFVYKNDTLLASGFTGADGNFETNSVMPGVYTLRLVYPSTGRRFVVNGVPVKALKVTPVNYTGVEPTADTAMSYIELMPPPPKKAK